MAILGANGAGKSTLLRVVSGKEDAREGDASFGSANVRAQYFAQNQADAMDLSKTVMRTIEDASAEGAERSYNELRALLGQFLFKGDDVQKKLESLSGGEKARVALCAMMLSPSNVLFLDEPTNHLDIPAKEMLEDALRHFDGTVVVVSHDRYFVSQVANTIFNIEDQKLHRWDGDYASYMENKDDLRERSRAGTSRARSPSRRLGLWTWTPSRSSARGQEEVTAARAQVCTAAHRGGGQRCVDNLASPRPGARRRTRCVIFAYLPSMGSTLRRQNAPFLLTTGAPFSVALHLRQKSTFVEQQCVGAVARIRVSRFRARARLAKFSRAVERGSRKDNVAMLHAHAAPITFPECFFLRKAL